MKISTPSSNLESLYLGPVEVWDEFCRAFQAQQLLLKWAKVPLSCLVFQGGTGVGKSSWINHFAGELVSQVSPVRPCTAKPLFLCSASAEGLLRESLNSVELDYWVFDIKVCDFALPGNWVLVDCPDYDSLEVGHHALSRFMLRLSTAKLLITSPAKYGDELTISALEFARDLGRPCKVMVNKWDTLPMDQIEEFQQAVKDIYQDCWSASAQVEQDIDRVKIDLIDWVQEIMKEGFSPQNGLKVCISELKNHCQENYGQRTYDLEKLSEKLSNDYSQFWERHQLIQLKIEKTLNQNLSRIAEEKIFYFSKFMMKHLFSFVSALKPGSTEPESSDGGDPFEYFAREIRENLQITLQQNLNNLNHNHAGLKWVTNYPAFDLNEKLKDFDNGFASLKKDIYSQLSEKFSKNAGTKHSVMAVSQEVLLSLVFYSFLGPIALLPGWEQVLSGLCYMVYGKIPSTHLPTVILELEQINDECRKKFEQFLRDILEEPNKSLREVGSNVQKNYTDFCKEIDSLSLMVEDHI